MTRVKDVVQGVREDKLTRLSLAGIFVVGIVSSLLSPNVTEGLLNSLIIPVFIGIYALGRWGITNPKGFLKAITLGAGFLGLVVILGRVFRADIWWGGVPILAGFRGRGNVLGIADNGLAAMLEVGVTGGLGFFLYQTRNRWLYLLSAVSALSAIFITLSRGSMVGTFFAVALLMAMNTALLKRHWKVITVLCLILVIAVATTPRLAHRVLSIFDITTDTSNVGRFEIWSTTLRMLKDHILLGVGPGQFSEFYSKYSLPSAHIPHARSPHSLYLFILAGWGIVGFIVFVLWAAGSVLTPVFKKPTTYRKIALAMITSFFVHVLFNDLFVAHVPLVMGVIAHPELDEE